MTLSQQKANIYRDIAKLKQNEFRAKNSCRCKGFCNINHSRHSWISQKSDKLIELLGETKDSMGDDKNDYSKCPKNVNSEFICKHCDTLLEDVARMRNHIKNQHDP